MQNLQHDNNMELVAIQLSGIQQFAMGEGMGVREWGVLEVASGGSRCSIRAYSIHRRKPMCITQFSLISGSSVIRIWVRISP